MPGPVSAAGAVSRSFAIGGGHLLLYRLMPEANTSEIVAYLMGGPFGITASMVVHRRWMQRRPA